jgi:hypothetical protein
MMSPAMAYAERELDTEAWAAALFQNRPPQQHEIASSLAGAIERGRLQEREACARIADTSTGISEFAPHVCQAIAATIRARSKP